LLEKKGNLWSFETPYRGEPSQHTASKGVIFLPAGIYLYAIGKAPRRNRGREYITYLKRNKKSNPGKADIKKVHKNDDFRKKKNIYIVKKKPNKKLIKKLTKNEKSKRRKRKDTTYRKKIPTRVIEVVIVDKNRRKLPAIVTVKKKYKGQVVYKKHHRIKKGKTKIPIPDDNNVEILVDASDHLPNKIRISRKKKKITIKMTPLKKGESLNLQAIEFAIDSAYLRSSSLDILNKIIRVMKRNPDLKFLINGHTDSTGSASYNKTLSKKRARAVKDYFVKNGISPLRLRTRGYGHKRPIASNRTRAGRARNRRTEIVILDR